MKKMKRLFLFLFIVNLSLSILSCSIYKSADRNDFEAAAPTLKIKSLTKTSCSEATVANEANHSRLLTVIGDEFVWQHDLQNITYFESTDLKGTYCFYDVTFE